MDNQKTLQFTVRDNEIKFCDKEGNIFGVTPSWENYDRLSTCSFEYLLLADAEKDLESKKYYEGLQNLYAMEADIDRKSVV